MRLRGGEGVRVKCMNCKGEQVSEGVWKAGNAEMDKVHEWPETAEFNAGAEFQCPKCGCSVEVTA